MSNKPRLPYLPLILIIIVIAIIMAIIVWFMPNSAETTTQNLSVTNNAGVSPVTEISNINEKPEAPALQNKQEFVTGLERLPRSLQGTEVDGEIIIDENKQLVVTEGLRHLFDYFLSALGEEDEATLYQRVESYIRYHTPEPAASQAIVIFKQYVSYLKQVATIEKSYGNLQMQATQSGKLDLAMVAQRQQDIARLRQQNFDAETIVAFFGTADAYDDYSISMLEIEQNNQLSATQKQAARQDYISRMPNNTTKANLEQQANLNALITRTEQMKAQNASAQELFAMRSELVGSAAASRLAVVDVEDADFDQRFDQYQTQKSQLLAQNAGNAQAQTQINQIEQQLFSEEERKRLSAYAAIQNRK